MDRARIEEAAAIIAKAKYVVALTGAGISVDSGIPDFRSPGGLWERFDPYDYAHIESFRRDPNRVWTMLDEMTGTIHGAKPNPGHIALADLEEMGRLHGIITQNIDNLHQAAGNTEIAEFHGNTSRLICLECGISEDVEMKGLLPGHPPVCRCGAIMKPDVVFFGEPIPPAAYRMSLVMAEQADVMLIIGTSATVAPANMLPTITSASGGTLIEVNRERTHISSIQGALSLIGNASVVLPALVAAVKERL